MFYDEIRGKCVTKSGERCKFGVEEDGESSLVEKTDCVTNSKCEEDGICTCNSEFHEVFNGTCQPSKSFGQFCSEEDKCSKFLHLHCINEVCNCNDEISVYSLVFGLCVGALNQNCINEKCVDGAECKGGKCLCDVDHYENTSTKTCVVRKNIHEECNNDSECIHKGLLMMKCTQGKCDCEEGYKYSKVQKSQYILDPNYRYDPERNVRFSFTGPLTELCVPLIGKACPDRYCGPNAQCKISVFELERYYDNDRDQSETLDVLMSKVGICECPPENPKLNKDKSGCGKAWMDGEDYHYSLYRDGGNICETNGDCVNNLVCYESRCKCPSPNHQKVNNDRDYCFTKIGGRCSTSSDCVVNLHCKLLPNATVGHCHCKEGFVDNIDGECGGTYGAVCDYKRDFPPCDKAAGLACINKKCSCKDIMYKYSETSRNCVALVGASCKEKISCVDNAECFPFHNDLELPRRCKCKPGFLENTNFTCDVDVNHVFIDER